MPWPLIARAALIVAAKILAKQAAKKAAQQAAKKAAQQAAKKAAKKAAKQMAKDAKKCTKECPKKAAERAKKAEQLKKNKANGAKREAEVKKELQDEGHEVLGEQVTVKTPLTNRRVDILIRDGKTGQIRAVEVKSGSATRNATQQAKDAALQNQGGTISGKNAPPELRGTNMKIPTEVRN